MDRAVLSAKVAALQHLIKLVACALEDVQHVRRRVLQLPWSVPTTAFRWQPSQVGQVVDVSIGECREAEAVHVAQCDGRESELTPAFLAQRSDMWVLQVSTCAPGRLVQEEHQWCQQGQRPHCPPHACPACSWWPQHLGQAMQRWGAGKSSQISHACSFVNRATTTSFGWGCFSLISLSELDFAHKLDGHVGRQGCYTSSVPWSHLSVLLFECSTCYSSLPTTFRCLHSFSCLFFPNCLPPLPYTNPVSFNTFSFPVLSFPPSFVFILVFGFPSELELKLRLLKLQ